MLVEFIVWFEKEWCLLFFLVLGINSLIFSVIGNDYGFEYIFFWELDSIVIDKDVFIVIFISGNSKNVVEVVKVVNEKGIKIWGWIGKGVGKMGSFCVII